MRSNFFAYIFILFLTLSLLTNTSHSTEHKVTKGDTLYSLAIKYGSTVNKLKQINNLSSNNLKIGQILLIPQTLRAENSSKENNDIKIFSTLKKKVNTPTKTAGTTTESISTSKKTIEVYNFATDKIDSQSPTTTNETASASQSSIYIVKSGDTLGHIAERLGVRTSDLRSINGINGSNIKIGQKLKVPGSSFVNAPTKRPRVIEATPDKHIVRKGDTLSQIAERYGVSVKNLKAYNRIYSNNIKVGSSLKIPYQNYKAPPQIKTVKYKVRRGDTLSSISVKFGTSVSTIKSLNGMRSNFLKVGQTVKVPRGKAVNTYAGNTVNYSVRSGDTLSTIAGKFDVSVGRIKSINNLSSSYIKKGQKLKIPSAGLSSKTVAKEIIHKVRSGESLYSISKKYDTSVSAIRNANNISGTKIAVNQTIKIPTNEKIYLKSETRSRYTSSNKEGSSGASGKVSDNLIEVAKKYLGAPYKFGGNSTKTGIDCSAYVKKVYSFFDVSLPRTARDIYKKGNWVKKNSLEKGDLVFFRTYAQFPSHVGIYIGDNKFIHASSASKKVTITNFNKNYYQKRYIGAKRIPIKGAFFDKMANKL